MKRNAVRSLKSICDFYHALVVTVRWEAIIFFIVKRQYGIQKDFQGQQEIAATLCFIFPQKYQKEKKNQNNNKK